MRIISETRLKRFLASSPRRASAEKSVKRWIRLTRDAAWKNPADVKLTFGVTADFVESDNGSELTVSDIHNNAYRMVTAIHYVKTRPAKGRVYVLAIMDHAEYDRQKWKRDF